MTNQQKLTNKDARAFFDACAFLRASYFHYRELFESGGDLRARLLYRTAPVFFGDLSQLLKEYLILQVCRLTDPEEMRGDKNLTVSFVEKNADFSKSSNEGARLKALSTSIHAFRQLILSARHKYISHHDRASVLDGKPLGAASQEAWDQFWRDLREFVQIVHGRYVRPQGGLDIDEIHGLTDADGLVRMLKQGTYFETLLGDNQVGERCIEIAQGSEFYDA